MNIASYVLWGATATCAALGAVSCSNPAGRGESLRRESFAISVAIPERALLSSSIRDTVLAGDTAVQECGGQICAPGQFCCGPASCGFCAPEMSSVYCPKTCGGR